MKEMDWNTIGFLEKHLNLPGELKQEAKKLSISALSWDSAHFNAGMHKLNFVPENSSPAELSSILPTKRSKDEKLHCFAEVPSEANGAIQILIKTGFTLVESRMTYFHLLENLNSPENPTRAAVEADIPWLRKTASGAVNPNDRYHNDAFFSPEAADRYLETYIENCIRGFAETVFVPDLEKPPHSFAALSRLHLESTEEIQPLYRIPLTACLPENKGWHYHLCLAALRYAKQKNAAALVMTTQTSNRAVIHNCEKLGFRIGSSFHIFAKEL